jgi:chaperonin GroES
MNRSKGMENKAKIQPCEYKVLVKPFEVEEKTDGGIIMPDEYRKQQERAQVRGTLIAIGGNAFENWNDPVPEIGQDVYFAKYAGIQVPGEEDDAEYRLLNDKDIAGILIE